MFLEDRRRTPAFQLARPTASWLERVSLRTLAFCSRFNSVWSDAQVIESILTQAATQPMSADVRQPTPLVAGGWVPKSLHSGATSVAAIRGTLKLGEDAVVVQELGERSSERSSESLRECPVSFLGMIHSICFEWILSVFVSIFSAFTFEFLVFQVLASMLSFLGQNAGFERF